MTSRDILEILSLVLVLVGMVAGFIWALFKVRDSVTASFSKEIKSLTTSLGTKTDQINQAIERARRESNENDERIRKEAGEGYAALRTKAHEIEMEVVRLEKDMYEKFTRRESLKEGLDRVEKFIEGGLKDLKEYVKEVLHGNKPK